MDRYVIDAYAWIEYLTGSEAGRKVRSVIEEDSEVYTCVVTVAEVISKVAREGGDVETAYEILTSNSQVVDIDSDFSKESGILHAKMRGTIRDFGLADAFVLTTARRTDSKILTADIHFKDIKEAILIT
ncbi:MAG: PIN domain-containing protein [Candidatus Bathyarchaeia archaeon]